ncbi:Uncharacterized protein FWK35_00010738 [Aphis craccivora]|uniref:Uncharacterized protein n=1 Tax=Aphis craccivora TaxID=307492 RepID=A0A6G0ZNR5_APHCR|nr:Uncharacterized protein FWK35_00010738 [Aphis craccivora]
MKLITTWRLQSGLLKDILLSRTKAYNAVAFVDFIVNVGENYFTQRLRDHAHEKHSESHKFYQITGID